MAARMEDTATPADETLLDAMAEEHVARMSDQAANPPHEHNTKNRQPAPETVESENGVFQSEPPSPTAPGEIVMDLPIRIDSVEIHPAEQEQSYEPTARASTETPPLEDTIEQEATTLAEEILSRQMADEVQLELPPKFLSPSTDIEAQADEPPESVEGLANTLPPTITPVRPKVAISTIRPLAQPRRGWSILIQAIIVLLSIAAVAMIAYLTGILNL